MRPRRDLVVWLAAVAMTASAGAAHADELTIRGTIAPAAWQAFEARFVDQSGRVIDDANGGISHSEGQGYGLILALAADDRASFERIWSFTQTELLLRDDGLAAWRMIFRTMQAYEAWQANGAWITANNPVFGPGVRERFEWASRVTAEDYAAAGQRRSHVRERLAGLLGDDTVLAIPTTPSIAPLRNLPSDDLESYRNRALSMLCSSGLSGLPQISLPIADMDGCPLGVSLVAPAGRDKALIDIARRILAG